LSGNGYNFITSTAPDYESEGSFYFNKDNTHSHEYYQSVKLSPFSGNQFAITVCATIWEDTRSTFGSVISQNDVDGADGMWMGSFSGQLATDHWSPGGAKDDNTIDIQTWYHIAWSIPLWQNHQYGTKIYVNGVERSVSPYSVDTVGSLVQDYLVIGN
jgi:hypothetical protein